MTSSNQKMPDERRNITPSPCPTCGKRLDAATGISTQGRPEPGDYSVCGYCGELLVFTEKRASRKLTFAEELALPDDNRKEMQKARDLVRAVGGLDNLRRAL